MAFHTHFKRLPLPLRLEIMTYFLTTSVKSLEMEIHWPIFEVKQSTLHIG